MQGLWTGMKLIGLQTASVIAGPGLKIDAQLKSVL
jgi:hypothetical protein